MKQIDSPCMNCSDREVGCHSSCDKYKEYKESVESRRTTVNETKAKELLNDILCTSVRSKRFKK